MCLCSYNNNYHYWLVFALQCASNPGLLNSESSSTAYKVITIFEPFFCC
jgi:hypothetical protein